jgi:AcrR family transcriptional regulator
VSVKGRSQAERSAATRAALLAAARAAFTDKGFAGAGREEIAEAAGVTRGALYHHFSSKQALLVAVVEDLEAELGAALMEAAMDGPDPLDRLRRGCMAFLDAALDPAVRRIVLLDAPAVLGWEAWRELDARFGLGLIVHGLEEVMEAGQIERQPVGPMAHLLLAAINEAALMIAQADDPVAARTEVGGTVEHLLSRL